MGYNAECLNRRILLYNLCGWELLFTKKEKYRDIFLCKNNLPQKKFPIISIKLQFLNSITLWSNFTKQYQWHEDVTIVYYKVCWLIKQEPAVQILAQTSRTKRRNMRKIFISLLPLYTVLTLVTLNYKHVPLIIILLVCALCTIATF